VETPLVLGLVLAVAALVAMVVWGVRLSSERGRSGRHPRGGVDTAEPGATRDRKRLAFWRVKEVISPHRSFNLNSARRRDPSKLKQGGGGREKRRRLLASDWMRPPADPAVAEATVRHGKANYVPVTDVNPDPLVDPPRVFDSQATPTQVAEGPSDRLVSSPQTQRAPSDDGAEPPISRPLSPATRRRVTHSQGFLGSRRSSSASWHTDVALDVTGTLDLLVAAGTHVGGEHESRSTPREDAYATATSNGDDGTAPAVLYAAVADGLGSTRLAQLAALACTRGVIDELQNRVPTRDVAIHLSRAKSERKEIAGAVVTSVARLLGPEQIQELAEEHGELAVPSKVHDRASAPASTVVFVAVVPDGQVTRGIWGAIGDAKLAVVDLRTSSVRWLTPPPSGDSRTQALPRHPESITAGQVEMAEGDVLLLLSDGMAEVLDELPKELTSLLQEMSTDVSRVRHALLSALEQRVQGELDDRTLVAVMRR
jgi:serine/threonine protein phosphatase PrpC